MSHDPGTVRCLPHRFQPAAARQLGWCCFLVGVLFSLGAVSAAHVDWPEFRGPAGDGHAPPAEGRQAALPVHWSESSNIVWKTAVPHRGWSTPVVMDNQVWLTSATVDGHDFFVIGLDADSGKIRVNERVFHSDSPEPLGNGASMNCYATPSPALEPGKLYVHFGSFGTAAVDTGTGQVLWKRDDLPCRHYRGPSSSVVLFKDLLILTMDGADLQYHVALHTQTGETVWKTKRSAHWNDEHIPGQMAKDGDLRKAHSTPLIATVNGKPQLLSAGAKAIYGYDPATGQELWKIEHPDFSVAPRPIYENGVAYFVSGLTKRELWAVKLDGTGPVTEENIVWKLKTHVGKYASPILVDGLIYTAAEESFLTCVEAKSGQVIWNERIGGKYAASPIYAGGRLYFCDQNGTTTVVTPGRQLDVVAKNQLDDGFMASPAVAGSALYLRTKSHLYRVESRGKL